MKNNLGKKWGLCQVFVFLDDLVDYYNFSYFQKNKSEKSVK
jgi:hypothetical protein